MSFNIGKKFSFPENTEIQFDNHVHSVTQKLCAQFVDDYDDYIASQIAETAKRNGISELVVLNKSTIMAALNKQIPKTPTDISKSELYGRCAVCGQVVHVGNRYCDQCGQAIDWGADNG
jgi:RNA polymerase-binding transcription factor DksA